MDINQNKPLWWSNCIHNQKYALRNRYFKNTKPINLNIELVDRIVDQLSKDLIERNNGKFKTTTIKEFLSTYKGNLRNRYEEGVKRTFEKGPKRNIDIFIKDEFYWEDKPPRTIFSRDYGFNALYGTITKPLEHIFMQHSEFAKGKNFIERGKLFSDKYHRFKYMVENDFSKFESSQRSELLKLVELKLYLNVFEETEHEFIENIFEHKLNKEMSSREGIKAKLYGCRGSGDMDTSLGNGILNYVACKYFTMINNVCEKDNLIIDGDDSIIFVNSIDNLTETFSDFGFECKLIIRKDYHDLDFCSGKFIKINQNQFYYVQNINKVLNTIQYYRLKNNMNKDQYYYTLGVMYSNLYPNFPIFKQLSENLKFNRGININFVKSMTNLRKFEGADKLSIADFDLDLIRAEFRTSFDINTQIEYNYNFNNLPKEPKFSNVNKEKPYIVKYKPEYETIKNKF
jgi:hypothetical protein